ncbi:hypothetical protein [Aquitalea pelogenes]|uniref:hypothetical protein n=1 Tax=Aquitalea pelogenes TaxID=1293573 RepID=UPI0019577151|nr:hypothetical protein [Aquitalea pelogenes]
MQVFHSPHGALRYHDLPGSGVPLLFVHGLGCAASSDFPRVAADPALAGRRRLLLDLLGAGFPTGRTTLPTAWPRMPKPWRA